LFFQSTGVHLESELPPRSGGVAFALTCLHPGFFSPPANLYYQRYLTSEAVLADG